MQTFMNSDGNQSVTVTDIKMPFWSMVKFMVKAVLASIPAMVILWLIGIGLTVAAYLLIGSVGLMAQQTQSSAASTPVVSASPSPSATPVRRVLALETPEPTPEATPAPTPTPEETGN